MAGSHTTLVLPSWYYPGTPPRVHLLHPSQYTYEHCTRRTAGLTWSWGSLISGNSVEGVFYQ